MSIKFLFTYPVLLNRLAVHYEMYKRGWEYFVWELLRDTVERKEYDGAVTTRETRPEVLEWTNDPKLPNYWFPNEIFNVKEELESFVSDDPDLDDILKGYAKPHVFTGHVLEFTFISNDGNEILVVNKNRLEKSTDPYLGQAPSHYIKTGLDDPLFEYYLYAVRRYKQFLRRAEGI